MPETIDIGPKKWTEIVKLLIFTLEGNNASEKGREIARKELYRMATVANMTIEAKDRHMIESECDCDWNSDKAGPEHAEECGKYEE